MASSQSKVAGSERTKLLETVRTLNASKADLKKAMDQLEEMKAARDKAELALTTSEKLALNQTDSLLKVEDQLRIGRRDQEKQAAIQPGAQAWLPAPMLYGKPLRDDASLRNPQGGEGALVADALGRSLLLPADMAQLKALRSKEVFLGLKQYLGMVSFLIVCDFLDFPLLGSSPAAYWLQLAGYQSYLQAGGHG